MMSSGQSVYRLSVVLGLGLLVGSNTLSAQSFEEQRKKVSLGIETQSEDAILRFLDVGLAEHKVSQAHSVAASWFLQNSPQNPTTILRAAQVAERCADYPAAVAFYQQYVAKADPKSAESQQAVMRLYNVMINAMRNQNNSAYLYMVNHAGKFMPYGQARQYNTWLLDQAWEGVKSTHDMRDYVTVLTAISRSGYNKPEVVGIYGDYFLRILTADRRYNGSLKEGRNIELGAALSELGKSLSFDERLKLEVTFLGDVWRYNSLLYKAMEHNKQKGVASKTIPSPPLASAEALLKKYPDAAEMVRREFVSTGWRLEAAKWTMSKEGEGEAKRALLKKYQKSMPAVARYQIIKSNTGRNDKSKNATLTGWFDSKKAGKLVMGSKTPEDKRLKEFKTLIADLDSASPKQEYLVARLMGIVESTPSVWPEMMKNDERQWVFYRTLAERMRINTSGLSWVVNPHDKNEKTPHFSEPHLRKLVEAEVAKGPLTSWLVMAWVNTYKPAWSLAGPKSDPAGAELMKQLMAMPQYSSLPYRVRMGVSGSLRSHGPEADKVTRTASRGHVFGDLLKLKEDADSAAVKAACQTSLSRLKTAPKRVAFGSHEDLKAIPSAIFEDPETMALILQVLDNPSVSPWKEGADKIYDTMLGNLQNSPGYGLIHEHALILWQRSIISYTGRRGSKQAGQRNSKMIAWVEGLADQEPSAGATMARAGMHLASYESTLKDLRGTLSNYLNKANLAMGIRAIAVDESDPSFPIYKSQSEYAMGNDDSAWQLFDENFDTAVSMHRKLSADYWLWVLERLIFQRDEERQKEVVQILQSWRKESSTAFSTGQAVMLDILYGDIARRQGGHGMDNALKIYREVAKKPEYAGAPEVFTAMLRAIEVQRVMKDFGGALETSESLIRMRIPELWATARYAKAEVYFDMESYDDTNELLVDILAREPNHEDAKILKGKVLIENKSLLDATEVDIVSKAVTQEAISPGEWLTVRLTDPTLAVGGGGVDIQVDVWADSGDRETILLSQFGDEKTKFRGRTRVELGAPRLGDNMLQVIGDDKIYYEYSKNFMDKVNMKDPKRGGPLTVVSDGILMASARKLLSVAEQKEADAAAMVRQLLKSGKGKDKTQEELLQLAKTEQAKQALTRGGAFKEGGQGEHDARSAVRGLVKPGNLIYLRVMDEDRSRTSNVDQLIVSVESSSGDQVGRVVLKETDTHTGVFEGTVRTSTAQPMAFASSTRSGLNPNMLISPVNAGAWQAASGKKKGTTVVTVDLNDNVPLETLTLTSSEEAKKLKQFRLMTGLRRGDLRPVAYWPVRSQVDNPLGPALLIVKQPKDRQARMVKNRLRAPCDVPYSLQALVSYLDKSYLLQGDSHEVQLAGPSQAFLKQAWADAPWVKSATAGRQLDEALVARSRAHFYVEKPVTRYFAVGIGKAPVLSISKPTGTKTQELKASSRKSLPSMVTLNGRALKWNGKTFEGQFNLMPGLQTLKIYSQGQAAGIGFGRVCKVFTRLPHENKWTEMSDTQFDPATFPSEFTEGSVAPPEVQKNPDGTQWTVRFSPGARARILALELLDYEGSEASLNRITLTATGGKKILPISTDYKDLRKNNLLEILPGDRVWVRYLDDRFVNKSKERLERSLVAGYSNAQVFFARYNPTAPSYATIPIKANMVRFPHNETLYVTVYDPDMDVTDKIDSLEAVVSSRSGSKVKITLREMGRGTFEGSVYVVKDQPATEGQIKCVDDDVFTLSYWDKENSHPGVPVQRKASIKHARYKQPKVLASHMTVGAVSELKATAENPVDPKSTAVKMSPVLVKPDANTFTIFPGTDAYIDIIAPHLQIYSGSDVFILAQTDRGRRLAAQQRHAAEAAAAAEGKPAPAAKPKPVFDVTVPGTRLIRAIKVEAGRRHVREEILRPEDPLNVYSVITPNQFDSYWQKNLNNGNSGVFRAHIISLTGFFEEQPLAVSEELLLRYATKGPGHVLSKQEDEQFRKLSGHTKLFGKHGDSWGRTENRSKLFDPLTIEPGERIHIGLRYEDEHGQPQWITAVAKTASHGKMTVGVIRDQFEHEGTVGLGDRLRVEVQDMGFDSTHDVDSLTVQVSATSGANYPLELKESDPHSGKFEGSFELVVSQGQNETNRNIAVLGFPATYKDTIQLTYTDSSGRQLPPEVFNLSKGSDGMIEPFSKQYGDDDIAVKTQFAMAEAYLEAAKSYKKSKQNTEAVLNYETAQQLLTSTLDRFSDPHAHARAEYLLGDLSYESARTAEDPEEQKNQYYAALSRFNKVTANYPEAVDAPKAQFKKAVTYERLKEPDTAAQEYVKLAYMYPDSEFLAVAMYRLGTHFRSIAKQKHRELAALQQQMAEDSSETVNRELRFQIDQSSQEVLTEYNKAGKIFGRLQQRFTSHSLAGKAGLRSSQCYFAAGEYEDALLPLKGVAEGENYPGVERAEAMYWMGKCYGLMNDNLSAYSIFLKCTEDFPETEWAGYALSELTQPALQAVESGLNKQIQAERKEMGMEK